MRIPTLVDQFGSFFGATCITLQLFAQPLTHAPREKKKQGWFLTRDSNPEGFPLHNFESRNRNCIPAAPSSSIVALRPISPELDCGNLWNCRSLPPPAVVGSRETKWGFSQNRDPKAVSRVLVSKEPKAPNWASVLEKDEAPMYQPHLSILSLQAPGRKKNTFSEADYLGVFPPKKKITKKSREKTWEEDSHFGQRRKTKVEPARCSWRQRWASTCAWLGT